MRSYLGEEPGEVDASLCTGTIGPGDYWKLSANFQRVSGSIYSVVRKGGVLEVVLCYMLEYEKIMCCRC